MQDRNWETVAKLVEWLDSESPLTGEAALTMRVLKISEELGEVAEAIHGVTGSNPRKGAGTHTWFDVEKELCDVILTGMVALASITPDAQKVFEERIRHIEDRSLGGQAAPSSTG